MAQFCAAMGVTNETRVLDIGGGLDTWLLLPPTCRPRVTILHFDPIPSARPWPAGIEYVRGSALAVPFAAQSFDVIFSNSVIEHVGDAAAQQRFATEVLQLRIPYWVQTPNFYFPIGPHFLGLGIQFLPQAFAVSYIRWGSAWGWLNRWSRSDVASALAEIRLITPREFGLLFPDARIRRERVLGFTKSLIAVGSG